MTNILQQTLSAPVTDTTCPKRRERVAKLAELVRSGKYEPKKNLVAVALSTHIDAEIEAQTTVLN